MKLGNWFLIYTQDYPMASTFSPPNEEQKVKLEADNENDALSEGLKKWKLLKATHSSVSERNPRIIYEIEIKEKNQ